MTCEERSIKERWMKKNETEDIPEDQLEEFRTQSSANSGRRNKLTEMFTAFGEKTNIV
jgi:hypothetical protein